MAQCHNHRISWRNSLSRDHAGPPCPLKELFPQTNCTLPSPPGARRNPLARIATIAQPRPPRIIPRDTRCITLPAKSPTHCCSRHSKAAQFSGPSARYRRPQRMASPISRRIVSGKTDLRSTTGDVRRQSAQQWPAQVHGDQCQGNQPVRLKHGDLRAARCGQHLGDGAS